MDSCKIDLFREEKEVWLRKKLGPVLLAGALLLAAGFFLGLLAGCSISSSLFANEGGGLSSSCASSIQAQEPDWGADVVIGGKTIPVLQWLDSELKPANIRENLK